MKEIIYVSEYAGYNPLRPDGKSIAQFKPYPVFDPLRGLVNKGVLVLDVSDKAHAKIQEELEAFPDFGHGFIKVKKLPTRASSEGTITGLRTGHEEPREAAQEYKKIYAPKIQQVLELRQKLFKADGSIKQGASDEELTELEALEAELGLIKEK